MRLLLISDTHGNQQFNDVLMDVALSTNQVIHLGDDYKDAEVFVENNIPIIRVPGTWCHNYQDSMIDNRRFEDFHGWRFFLTHTPSKDYHDLADDIDPNQVIVNQQCDVFCHGHTHEPRLSELNGVSILNPGHLKADVDRGFRSSYAIIDLTKTTCSMCIHDFKTSEIINQKIIEK